jgi:hypothetical protein
VRPPPSQLSSAASPVIATCWMRFGVWIWLPVAGLLDLQARHGRVQAARAEQEALRRRRPRPDVRLFTSSLSLALMLSVNVNYRRARNSWSRDCCLVPARLRQMLEMLITEMLRWEQGIWLFLAIGMLGANSDPRIFVIFYLCITPVLVRSSQKQNFTSFLKILLMATGLGL